MRAKITVLISALAVGMLLSSLLVLSRSGSSSDCSLVPRPEKMERHKGAFMLHPETRILAEASSMETAQYLGNKLRKSTGFPLPVIPSTAQPGARRDIQLKAALPGAKLGAEAYELSVTEESVTIQAADSAGFFYGAQTLLQLLPPEVFKPTLAQGVKWRVPCIEIQDRPRFPWRGALLDVSRHFFTKAEVERFLEAMALHKLNRFHWHLTDDQGWRLEIKKYPRLTEVGAWRKSIGYNLDSKSSTAYGTDGRYGGFYTQEDIHEVVAYARKLHITIVPEIEMPGHSSAALAAYPELSCSGGPYTTDMAQAVLPGVYCAGNERTFEFLENVLVEVMQLFPGDYIHLGGDEVPKQNWNDCPRCQARMREQKLSGEAELEGYFIQRLGAFLASRGRKMIGWSETRQSGLPPGAVLMDWIGGASEAARGGHDVVMCPNEYCYFDYYQSRNRAAEPPAIGAYLSLAKVYSFEPIPPSLEPQYQAHILGAQGNLWTEYMPSMNAVNYMSFPRLCALAEVTWSPRDVRNWEVFNQRMQLHYRRLEQMGIAYRRPKL